jgi:hypothetical protein
VERPPDGIQSFTSDRRWCSRTRSAGGAPEETVNLPRRGARHSGCSVPHRKASQGVR